MIINGFRNSKKTIFHIHVKWKTEYCQKIKGACSSFFQKYINCPNIITWCLPNIFLPNLGRGNCPVAPAATPICIKVKNNLATFSLKVLSQLFIRCVTVRHDATQRFRCESTLTLLLLRVFNGSSLHDEIRKENVQSFRHADHPIRAFYGLYTQFALANPVTLSFDLLTSWSMHVYGGPVADCIYAESGVDSLSHFPSRARIARKNRHANSQTHASERLYHATVIAACRRRYKKA